MTSRTAPRLFARRGVSVHPRTHVARLANIPVAPASRRGHGNAHHAAHVQPTGAARHARSVRTRASSPRVAGAVMGARTIHPPMIGDPGTGVTECAHRRGDADSQTGRARQRRTRHPPTIRHRHVHHRVTCIPSPRSRRRPPIRVIGRPETARNGPKRAETDRNRAKPSEALPHPTWRPAITRSHHVKD